MRYLGESPPLVYRNGRGRLCFEISEGRRAMITRHAEMRMGQRGRSLAEIIMILRHWPEYQWRSRGGVITLKYKCGLVKVVTVYEDVIPDPFREEHDECDKYGEHGYFDPEEP